MFITNTSQTSACPWEEISKSVLKLEENDKSLKEPQSLFHGIEADVSAAAEVQQSKANASAETLTR